MDLSYEKDQRSTGRLFCRKSSHKIRSFDVARKRVAQRSEESYVRWHMRV